MKPLALAILALAAAPASVKEAAPAVSVMTSEPRSFGYFVGDVFRREITVTVAEPYRLAKASQPAPGRVNYWLDLRAADVNETEREGQRRYHIALDYQTFYVPLSPTEVIIPGLTLRFTDDRTAVDAKVPPLSIIMSPLREVQPEKPPEGPAGYLKPDAVPGTVSTRNARIGLAAGTACALLALGLLAYHHAWWPFRARPERPFTRAASALKGRLAHDGSLDVYQAGLLDLHRAFDSAAGRRLLAEDVPGFLAARHEFQPLEEEIARFFANSRRAFFGNDLQGAVERMPLAAVAALGSRLGEAERRAT